MSKAAHTCNWQQSKRGSFEVCSVCQDRFPCQGNDCGHLDCHEARGKAPMCHFCKKIVTGPRKEAWGTGNIRNHTRTFHYLCRDENQP
jgi:hypothetical protein